jgi:hypothetical protein
MFSQLTDGLAAGCHERAGTSLNPNRSTSLG